MRLCKVLSLSLCQALHLSTPPFVSIFTPTSNFCFILVARPASVWGPQAWHFSQSLVCLPDTAMEYTQTVTGTGETGGQVGTRSSGPFALGRIQRM